MSTKPSRSPTLGVNDASAWNSCSRKSTSAVSSRASGPAVAISFPSCIRSHGFARRSRSGAASASASAPSPRSPDDTDDPRMILSYRHRIGDPDHAVGGAEVCLEHEGSRSIAGARPRQRPLPVRSARSHCARCRAVKRSRRSSRTVGSTPSRSNRSCPRVQPYGGHRSAHSPRYEPPNRSPPDGCPPAP